MKKKWKVLSAVLACLMLTGSLVACGNNTEDPTDTLAKSTVAEEESQELKDWLPDDTESPLSVRNSFNPLRTDLLRSATTS